MQQEKEELTLPILLGLAKKCPIADLNLPGLADAYFQAIHNRGGNWTPEKIEELKARLITGGLNPDLFTMSQYEG